MKVLQADCQVALASLKANSIDAIVTDPPYGLSNHSMQDVQDCLSAWIKGEEYKPNKRGFMGKSWDAWVPGPEIWRECYRVLKPGGHMLVFAGTRSQDLMGIAVRLAGFELRDTIQWIYGSGFPKSHDVSKAIDKLGGKNYMSWFPEWLEEYRNKAGVTRNELATHFPSKSGGVTGCIWNWEHGIRVPTAEQFNLLCALLHIPVEPLEVVERRFLAERKGVTRTFDVGATETLKNRDPITAPATEAAKKWEGWGTALKPAYEPILMCRKPLEGTVAQNVLEHGTGALNIDGCRVAVDPEVDASQLRTMNRNQRTGDQNEQTWGLSKNRGDTPTVVRPEGRWPANIILSHSPDCKLRGMKKVKGASTENGDVPAGEEGSTIPLRRGSFVDRTDENGMEEVEDWECVEGCPIWEFPITKSGKMSQHIDGGSFNVFGKQYPRDVETIGDQGSAARFFYCAKASRKERNAGLSDGDKNNHPTVKPLSLMRYLVRMVTPLGGVVLDPFCGSGSTGCAAVQEGMSFLGIDLSEAYCEIAVARIAVCKGEELDDGGTGADGVGVKEGESQLSLF